MGLFSNQEQSYLGVDIGASGIKIVELKREGEQARLINYAFSENNDPSGKMGWQDDVKKTGQLIKAALAKGELNSTRAVASLPSYAVFISFINLVNIDKKSIDQAVFSETKKIIPVPIENVNLEWRLIESKIEGSKEHLKIFVTAVPKVLIQKYRETFKEAGLSLISLEPEIFSLIRALVGRDKARYLLIDMGGTTTNLAVVEHGIPVFSRSLDLGGYHFTEKLAKGSQVSLAEAEQLKYDLGINAFSNKEKSGISLVMPEAIAPIINEVKYLLNMLEHRASGKVEKIILSGGSSLLVNLAPYMEKILDSTVVVGDPWSRISYPLELEPLLKEIGPKLAVAGGLALNSLE
jgi:type IV pilus assembly protein PilM